MTNRVLGMRRKLSAKSRVICTRPAGRHLWFGHFVQETIIAIINYNSDSGRFWPAFGREAQRLFLQQRASQSASLQSLHLASSLPRSSSGQSERDSKSWSKVFCSNATQLKASPGCPSCPTKRQQSISPIA